MYEGPPPDAEPLYKSPFAEIVFVPSRQLVWIIRTGTPFTDVQVASRDFQLATEAMPKDLSKLRLLVDVRRVIGRNDPQFEDMFDQFRRQIFVGFARSAILVKSAIGRLQIQRLGREIGIATNVFHEPAEALAFLAGS